MIGTMFQLRIERVARELLALHFFGRLVRRGQRGVA
jgi:hypothetical protein